MQKDDIFKLQLNEGRTAFCLVAGKLHKNKFRPCSVSNETETLESLDNFSVSKSRDRKYRDFRDFRDQIY